MRLRHRVAVVTAAVCAVAATLAAPAIAAEPTTHETGTLPDGATWVADIPQHGNGTVILFSHGFGPLIAADAPDAATDADLLAQGYTLVGSSYSGPSWWALSSAVHDQFAALAALERRIPRPQRVIAWGESMGGLISAEEAQDRHGPLAGALTTCGLVAGALNLNNYQLDGEYALNELLAPNQPIRLVDYPDPTSAATAASQLTALATTAQQTAVGRARLALAAALLNEPTWAAGPTPPAPTDYAGQEAQQAGLLTGGLFTFIVPARFQVELAAGGNSSFTRGVDYTALLRRSSYRPEVQALYHTAGLDLGADLTTLTRNADIVADPPAITTLDRTSMVTGRLAVPEFDIHTIADQLVPVQQENWYAARVRDAGDRSDLRQAYVLAAGHCNFTPAETITALHALEHRLDTGHWDEVTEPAALNTAAATSGLGPAAPYSRFHPPVLANARSRPFHGR
jgi:hypothetical protein